MAEPNTAGASLGVLLVAGIGPVAGPYALIVGGAVIGALWPLSSMDMDTGVQKRQGAFFLLRIVTLAVLVSSAGAWYLNEKTGLPIYDASAVISCIIGAIGDGWGKIIVALRTGFAGLVSGGKSNGNT